MGATGAAGSGRIFISYRREETAYPAGWLYDRLDERFGGSQVFKDVDSIPLGDDFVEAITRAVGSCDVLLALIGDRWLTITDDRGALRLEDEDDYVRLEIEAALARDVRVIPVLVDGARMPKADELPRSLVALTRRQALELSPSRFDFDTDRLFKVLDGTLAEVRTGQSAEVDESPPDGPAEDVAEVEQPPPSARAGGGTRRWAMFAALGAAAAAILLIAAILAMGDDDDDGGIEVDTAPATSEDGLEVSGLEVDVRNDPPVVDDTLTLSYVLTNTTDAPIELADTFVGVRNPDDVNLDSENENEGAVIDPGASIDASGRVLLDSAGTWRVWPCYTLADGTLCPQRWQVVFVPVDDG